MIYNYLCLKTIEVFVGQLRKKTEGGLKRWLWAENVETFHDGCDGRTLLWWKDSGCPVGVSLHWSAFWSHELPDLFFRGRSRSGKSSVGTLFFMNRPPLPSPGRHFQLLAVANSVGIEKPTMGSPGEDNRCYWLTLLTDPWRNVFQSARRWTKTEVGRN